MDNVRQTTDRFFELLKDAYFDNSPKSAVAFLQGECRLLSLLNMSPERKYLSGELAKRLGLTTARIASTLKTLEKKGYILREADPSDRRIVNVSITKEGTAYICAKREESSLYFDSLFERMGEEDSREFLRIIEKITDKKGEN